MHDDHDIDPEAKENAPNGDTVGGEPLRPSEALSRDGQITLGLVATSLITAATLVAAIVDVDATPIVAMIGTLGLVALTPIAKLMLGWNHFGRGVAIGFGVTLGTAVLILALLFGLYLLV